MIETNSKLQSLVICLITAVLIVPSVCQGQNRKTPTGIRNRLPWTTSKVTGTPDPPSPYRVERAFPHLSFEQPTVLTQAPGGSRWYLAELTGKVFSFADDPNVKQKDADLFIDLTQHIERVMHIYGMTFHPDFEKNGYVYICYLQGQGFAGNDRLSRFKVTPADPPRCDPASEQLLLEWPTGGHNGCCLKFGPDGYLYFSSGDGASPSPPDNKNTGQDISDIKSSILRIDVNRSEAGRAYAIPKDNPFVDHPNARPEVWAYGFRNPWKMSFDPATGDLWVGDIGWDMWEMVFRVERGGNYGWPIVEGGQPIRADVTPGPTPIQQPVTIHPRSEFRSITGGFVYHGKTLPELEGAYLYGDFVTGQLWGLRYDGQQVTWKQELVDARFPIIACAVDHDGEFYMVDYGKRSAGNEEEGGSIYRLQPNDASEVNQGFPQLLSDTGLYSSAASIELAPGVIPYSINAEPWADGAVVNRAVAVPNQEKLGTWKEDQILLGQRRGALSFPKDSVLVKTLSLNVVSNGTAKERPVETQILHNEGDEWRGYTFAWNDAGTDASLVSAQGSERVLRVADSNAPDGSRQKTWRFSARKECQICHTVRSGSVLGFKPSQLNRQHQYGDVVAPQLATLSHIELFSDPVAKSDPIISPADTTASLEQRARAYLDVNCSHCHGNGNAGTAQFRLQQELSLGQTGLLDSSVNQGDFGLLQPRIVASGDPYRSLIYYRMAKLGKGRMPHIGSHVVDTAGLRLIHDWIQDISVDQPPPLSSVHELKSVRASQMKTLRKLKAGTGSVASLLDNPSGGLLLQHEMFVGGIKAQQQTDILRAAGTLTNPQIRELFDPFVPEEDRPKKADLNPQYVLGLNGDSERGKRLFTGDRRLQCRKCHKAGKEGGDFGPNLADIGRKYKPGEMLASILTPSAKIAPEYIPWLLVTKDGIPHSGLLVMRTEEGVTLKNSDGKIIEIPTDDIEEMIAQDVSFMPKDALRDITAEEAADLLTFLTSLK
jgi:putative heme-binding domain-containing protein